MQFLDIVNKSGRAHTLCTFSVLFHKGAVLFDCNRGLVAQSLAFFCSLSSLTSGDSSRC